MAGGPEGTIDFRLDEAAGIIRVTGTGAWSPQQVDRHFADLAALVARCRERQIPVKVLVDITASAVQSHEAMERTRVQTGALYRRGDRIALVVKSSLVKMQMRRALDMTVMELFISRKAAEIWLQAYTPPSALRAGGAPHVR